MQISTPVFYETGFNFETAVHHTRYQSSASKRVPAFDFDFSVPDCPVRFKSLDCYDSVRVYEGGRVVINNLGYRKPDVRYQLSKAGIETVLTKDITGVKLFTPDEESIPRSSITPKIMYFDPVFQRAYLARWNVSIVIPCKGAMPMGEKISVTTRRKDVEKDLIERLGDTLALADTTFKMHDMAWAQADESKAVKYVRALLKGGTVNDPMEYFGLHALLGVGRMLHWGSFVDFVKRECSVVMQYEYLEYKHV